VAHFRNKITRLANVETVHVWQLLLYHEYQPKGGDALRLGRKGRYGSCVGGR